MDNTKNINKHKINIKIAGAAGAGVKSTGQILSKSLTRLGFSTFSYREYPSLIRGGHTTYQTLAAVNEEVHSQKKDLDILLVFDEKSYQLHENELTQNSLVIYCSSSFELNDVKGKKIGVPLIELANEAGSAIMANSVALGALFELLCINNLDSLKQTLKQAYISKGEEVVQNNYQAVEKGREYIRNNFSDAKIQLKTPEEKKDRMVITGNEAAALGAISAGLRFYCAYPMTPATSILHYLAAKAEETDIIVKQPEDEIAAINMAIGASFAGVRAMTATSGGGFCLMTEGLGLAGISETPLVIIESMRTGPASGLPTWSGQGDLRFVIHASQDEFPRVILAPGDATETFEQTRQSFELAEKYQIPVIILLDKNISESDYSCDPFKDNFENKRFSFVKECNQPYLRYRFTENNISPRPFLGQNGCQHLANSYDHDQEGYATENSETRIKMMDKRNKKMENIKREIPKQQIFGNPESRIGIISWGSNKGAILEALKELPEVSFLHMNWLWPFPAKQVKEYINKLDKCICIEGNSHGQLAGIIREKTGKNVEKMLKYDGRPFYPYEIIEKLK